MWLPDKRSTFPFAAVSCTKYDGLVPSACEIVCTFWKLTVPAILTVSTSSPSCTFLITTEVVMPDFRMVTRALDGWHTAPADVLLGALGAALTWRKIPG